MRDVLINKILAEENSVLIKVLRIEWRENNNEQIYAIWAFLQEWVYRCRIRDVNHLKGLIQEWRYFDHGIIDRAVTYKLVLEVTAKVYPWEWRTLSTSTLNAWLFTFTLRCVV